MHRPRQPAVCESNVNKFHKIKSMFMTQSKTKSDTLMQEIECTMEISENCCKNNSNGKWEIKTKT